MRARYFPIYAVSETWSVTNALALNWGVASVVALFNPAELGKKVIDPALETVVSTNGMVRKGDVVVVIINWIIRA